MNPARLFKNPKSETNYSWPIGHPGTIKITKHYPPPSPPRSINRAGPGDGGGLRWGWTKYIPPHPHPLPCLRRSGFAQAGTKGRGRYRQVLRILFLIHEKGLCLIVPNFS